MSLRRFAAQMELGERTLTLETGHLAGQADGSILMRYGDTVVLTTAVMADTVRSETDFFPLLVDYEEKMYAAGKIPGSFFRREGRPTEQATLAARVIDRPLRPLFPYNCRNDVQIIITVLSADAENPPDILGILAASAAARLGGLPLAQTVGASRVGIVEGQLVPFPTYSQMADSPLNLTVAGTREMVNMIECSADSLSEGQILEAVKFGHQIVVQTVDFLDDFIAKFGKPPKPYQEFVIPDELRAAVEEAVGDRLAEALLADKVAREQALQAVRDTAYQALGERFPGQELFIHDALDDMIRRQVRQMVVQGKRVDGRGHTDIRPIEAEVSLLPRAHGSALFARGRTQVLTTATLGAPGDSQRLDTIADEDRKRYMHHYNSPPFSFGEVSPLRGPRRRDIGHGALAEKAMLSVLPREDEFPYTVRTVSEVLESNGSTSMASTCASSLALMDAGVPIRAPVAGIAIGLVREDGRHILLSDIEGLEDFNGDMDFKVAGTARGVTAIQLDLKIQGLPYSVIGEALEQAKEARLQVLEKMRQAIAAPRAELSAYAPRIVTVRIDPAKIGEVIGPGGKTIRRIVEETGATIDVEDDGRVFVTSVDKAKAEQALQAIRDIVAEVEIGQVYTGKVTRVIEIGAFVEVLPGKEGMIHISELSWDHVRKVEDVVRVGDIVQVKVIEIDERGRINLSLRRLQPRPENGAVPRRPARIDTEGPSGSFYMRNRTRRPKR